MSMYTQDNRLIQLHTPLGKDALLLQAFSGAEAVSSLFHFDLQLHSENNAICFECIIGKPATIQIIRPDQSPRFINGIINSFVQGGSSERLAQYQATLVPWLWLLTRTRDCRIFQRQSVPEIITTIFEELGFPDFELRLRETYEEREYCVQYRESDFNFVSRLMEEEGIYYFFEHEEDKHALVLADSTLDLAPSSLQPVARYGMLSGGLQDEDLITEFTVGHALRSTKFVFRDFNFERPRLDLTSNSGEEDDDRLEVFDYPGEYGSIAHGERIARVRIEEEEAQRHLINGAGICSGFAPGCYFELSDHYRMDLNRNYSLIAVTHRAEQGDNYECSAADGLESFHYENQFQCLPWQEPYRPPRTTPIPTVQGTQTAIVVGPEGEEIYTDQHGRVKVQFHWDRRGHRNQCSSCWVRVSQPWGGESWGTISIPRIGQEVVVDFLEGDPDQPLIIGRVYNGDQMPPYNLPEGKVVSGWKTQSTPGGGGYNEISLDDTKGKEQITIHGQYDMNSTIEHDQMWFVKNDRKTTVEKNDVEEVKEDQTLRVKGKRSTAVYKDEIITVRGSRNEKVKENSREFILGRKEAWS